MAWLTIEGAKPYDGRYELTVDIGQFTRREWRWIKRYSGYLPFTFNEGFEGGDADLFAVFAVIALCRAKKIEQEDVETVLERFDDLPPFSTYIKYEADPAEAEEDDAGPPAQSSNGSSDSSGEDSKTSSATSDATPSAAGTRDSDISVSPPPRLVT